MGTGQRNLPELLHLHPQPVGLAGQKRACPCRTKCIHGIVHHHTVLYQNNLGVLSTDLENRAHLWIQRGCPNGMGRDLIFHHRRPNHGPHQPPGRPGRAS